MASGTAAVRELTTYSGKARRGFIENGSAFFMGPLTDENHFRTGTFEKWNQMIDHNFVGFKVLDNASAVATVVPKDSASLSSIVLRITVVNPSVAGAYRDGSTSKALAVRIVAQWKNGFLFSPKYHFLQAV